MIRKRKTEPDLPMIYAPSLILDKTQPSEVKNQDGLSAKGDEKGITRTEEETKRVKAT